MRASAHAALWCVVVAACEQRIDDTPEDALSAWVSAMNDSRSDPAARERAYALLSQRARDSLSARASRAAQLSGRNIQPWEMLAPGRFALRFAFDRGALRARITGERAVVTVRGPRAEESHVPMVREGGRWRVELVLPPQPALAAPMALPVDAGYAPIRER